jgi:hypothetical protein
MSFKEIFLFRIPQQFQYLISGRIQKLIKVSPKNIELNPDFIKTTYNLHNKFDLLIDIENQSIYNFFDKSLDLNQPIDWCKDYKNNVLVHKKYYAAYDKQNFNEVGDIKYVFEPSRFYFLPFLALDYSINDDNESLEKINRILREWKDQNPFLNSIHWTSGIEVGIRSINLIYTHMVLSYNNKIPEAIDLNIRELIIYSYKFLAKHLSLYSSANNHLIAELAGLNAISSYFTSDRIQKDSRKWINMLFNEIVKQVNEDGVNSELCTHYHAEVTDHFLQALRFVERSKTKIPKQIHERYKKMFAFVRHVEYNGLETIFGDNDEGYLINPYYDKSFSLYDSLILSANMEFNLDHYAKNQFDLRNFLIYGDDLESVSKVSAEKIKDEIFKESGYAFLYDHVSSAKASFDFGQIGDKISAAHGHSDIFHFNFELQGEQILIDSGTFQYHKRFSDWRSYFRGVTAHNTISIENSDHAFQNSRMSWLNLPKIKLIDFKISREFSFIEAETDAFKKHNVIHRRSLWFNKKDKFLQIKDTLKSTNNFQNKPNLYFYLNFGNHLVVNKIQNSINITTKNGNVTLENDFFRFGKVFKANNKDFLGWRSTNYGSKQKGQYFKMKLELVKETELNTIIKYG